jgi:hypothetical protein
MNMPSRLKCAENRHEASAHAKMARLCQTGIAGARTGENPNVPVRGSLTAFFGFVGLNRFKSSRTPVSLHILPALRVSEC